MRKPLAVLLVFLMSVLTACGEGSPTPGTEGRITTSTAAPATTQAPAANTPTVTTQAIQTAPATNTPATIPTVTPLPASPTTASATTTPVPTTQAPTATAAPTTTAAPTATPVAVKTNRLVYEAGGEIFISNPDGSNRTKLTKGYSPIFSPDGQRVAFVYPQGKGVGEPDSETGATISVMSVAGGGREELCKLEAHRLVYLDRWSPRGKFIAFNFVPTNIDGGAPRPERLCSVADKRVDKVNIGAASADQGYDWSPDGNYAVWQTDFGPDDFNLFYGDPDNTGKDAVKVTTGQNRIGAGSAVSSATYYAAARFSPDGKTIAVGGSKLFFVSVPGKSSPFQGKVVEGLGGSSISGLAWSPDGQSVAVVVRTEGVTPKSDLKLVDLSGGQPGKITLLQEGAEAVDWTR